MTVVLLLTARPAWFDQAECRGLDPELFYPVQGGDSREAKALCQICPVREECLAMAMARPEVHGIWGGMSERQRKRIRDRNKPGRRPIQHGTPNGYRVHKVRGETPCPSCREASNAYRADRKARARAS